MNTRHVSGYARQPAELYETPAWVLDALVEHLPLAHKTILEPSCGSGKLVRAMERHLVTVIASDLNDYGWGHHVGDFLTLSTRDLEDFEGIVGNPPFGPRGETAVAFIRRGLALIERGGFMALLLPATFDNAMGRADLFENCPAFVAKITLRKRIMWFPGTASPKENHAWFVYQGGSVMPRSAPRLLYGPKIKEAA